MDERPEEWTGEKRPGLTQEGGSNWATNNPAEERDAFDGRGMTGAQARSGHGRVKKRNA